jgi:hypothetical protein
MFETENDSLVYLAGQAPLEPQSWFSPKMSPKPPQNVWVSDYGKRKYTSAAAAGRECGEDFQLVNQLEVDAWNLEYRKQRLVQWPGAWAREVLKTI